MALSTLIQSHLRWLSVLLFVSIFSCSFAQVEKILPEDYVEKYYEIAVRKMHEYNIPASITLAQGILESGSGNSALARTANNHFGIKCHSDWTGDGYYMDDDEANECFRVYSNPEESFADHSLFLTTRARYKFLFEDYKTSDYKGWAKGLKKAGYATNPNYPNLLINLIEKYDLFKYDKMNYVPQTTTQPVAETKPTITKPVNNNIVLPKGAYFTDSKSGIFIYNRIKTVKSQGRQALELASLYGVSYDRLLKYNDLNESDKFEPNQNVFLQPKRKKGAQKKHRVENGETMWEISQLYGIKLKKLYAKNLVSDNSHIAPGEIAFLTSKRKTIPKTITYAEVLAAKKAAKNGIEKERKLIEKNPSNEEQPEEESTIVIYEEEPIENKVITIENVKAPEVGKTHVVQPKETLYFISNKYYVSVEEIVKWNNLPDYNLKVGQVLLVSPNE